MTEKTLLDSLQYVEDALVEEAAEYRPRRRSFRKWAVPAACLALVLGAGLILRSVRPAAQGTDAPPILLPTHRSGAEPVLSENGGRITGSGLSVVWPGPGETAVSPGGLVVVPGDPAPQLEPPAEPTVFAWSDIVHPLYSEQERAEVILVGRPLTEEQVEACAPGLLPEWAEEVSGSGSYRLADGSGGLAYVQMSVGRGETEEPCTVTLREAAENADVSRLTGEDLPTMNGQGYRAFREYFRTGDGERVTITVAFLREKILYTLSANVPTEAEDSAARDLRDLLLAYTKTESVPDLESFAYSGGGD